MAEPISVDGYRRPSTGVLALEAPRAVGEMGAYAASALMLRSLPRGDGHPVLVLPGFTASDLSTRALRRTLRSWGYSPTAGGWAGTWARPTKCSMASTGASSPWPSAIGSRSAWSAGASAASTPGRRPGRRGCA